MRSFALVTLACAVDPREQFEEFKQKFHKVYASDAEEGLRFEIFKETLQRIEDGNTRNGAPVFGITWIADRKIEEKYKKGRKGYADTRFVHTAPVNEPLLGSSPKDVDWRKTKAVTAVKNQGQCGSCWAFSTAEEVESMYILHNSAMHLENFSPQQVASCVPECDGCGGGDTVTAFEYLKTTKLAQGPFWPYVQGLTPVDQCMDKQCTEACSSHDVSELTKYEFYIGPYAQVTGFKYATPTCTDACDNQDLGKLAASAAEGPVSICVNAGAWNDYTGGVLTDAGCGGHGFDDLDHCVQLVGYNTTAEKPYWIVRNSWDTGFGEAGYIYLEYNANTCGLANEATIALLEKTAPAGHFEALYEQAAGEPYVA